ncbi:MAG: hypothetical protein PHU53_07495 [Thermoplasmata archaeon]|nr:hypothetical protein [Thermoplasmata archaeon]
MMFRQYLGRENMKVFASHAAMYTMLGFAIGFLIFYDMFYYYCAPFNSSLPPWAFVAVLALAGILGCYLYPDIIHVMLSAVLLPALGAVFCFILYVSPAFSPEMVTTSLSDGLFVVAQYIIFDMILAFITVFASGFVSLYFFDS